MHRQGLLLAVLVVLCSAGRALSLGTVARGLAAGGGLVPLLRRTEGGSRSGAGGGFGRIGGAGSTGLLLARLGDGGRAERMMGSRGLEGTDADGLLRLRGGYKGTSSQGKRGTGSKSHPSYKYNLR